MTNSEFAESCDSISVLLQKRALAAKKLHEKNRGGPRGPELARRYLERAREFYLFSVISGRFAEIKAEELAALQELSTRDIDPGSLN